MITSKGMLVRTEGVVPPEGNIPEIEKRCRQMEPQRDHEETSRGQIPAESKS